MTKLHVGTNNDRFIGFINTCMKTAKQHAPCKQGHVQGYQWHISNKTLSKEIMTRERNRFRENRN